MTEEKIKSIWITLAPYLGAVILDIALCGLLVVSGKELTVEAVVAITGCVGGLLFFQKKGGGGSLAAGGVLLVASSLLVGCAPCQIEQHVVNTLGAGLAASEELLNTEDEETVRALQIAGGAHAVGAIAVESCELTRDQAGWREWVSWALESAIDIAARFGAAGQADEGYTDEPPDELTRALMLLVAEQ